MVAYTRFGLTATLPAAMEISSDRDDRFEAVDLDREAMVGQVYSLILLDPGERERMLNEMARDAEVEDEDPVRIGGVRFDRHDYAGEIHPPGQEDTDIRVAGTVLFLHEPGAFGNLLAIHLATVGHTRRETRDYVESVLETLSLSGAAEELGVPAPFSLMNGLLSVRQQPGMSDSDGSDHARITLYSRASRGVYAANDPLAQITIDSAASGQRELDRVIDIYTRDAVVTEGEFQGVPAWVVDGALREGLGRYGETPEASTARSYVLRRCMADGAPVVIRFAGTDAWLAEGNSLDALVALTALTLPEDATECDPTGFEALAIAAGVATAPEPEVVPLLGGLGTLSIPHTWRAYDTESLSPSLRDDDRLVSLRLDLNRNWRTADALSELIEGAPDPVAATLFGRPAQRVEGPVSPAFSQRAALSGYGPMTDTPELGRVYRIDGCVNGAPLLVMMAAHEGWLVENGGFEALEALLTMDLPDPVPTCQPWDLESAESFLNGVLRMRIGWDDNRFVERNDPTLAMVRRANNDSVRLTAAAPAGDLLAEALGAQEGTGPGFAPGVRIEAAEVMGEAAHIFHGQRVFWRENRVDRQVVLFDRCLPDGSPVVVQMEAPGDWLAANGGFGFFLHHSWLVLPEAAPACDPAILAAAIERTGATEDGAVAPPAEPEQPPTDQPPAVDAPVQQPPAAAEATPSDAAPDAPLPPQEPPQDDTPAAQPSDGPQTPPDAVPDAVPVDDQPGPDAPAADGKPGPSGQPPAGTVPPATVEEPTPADPDQAAWGAAQSDGTPAGMLDYLVRFPDGAHADAARAWLSARAIMPPGMTPPAAPAPIPAPILDPDDAAWYAAEQAQSPAMMLEYLTHFPRGLRAEDARAWLMARAIMPPAAPAQPTTPPVQRGK